MGEGASLPNRKPWLGAAVRPEPSRHGVALGSVRSSSLPPRRTLLGFQRTAPSQGQVCSAVGPALCQLPARSRFSSRDPGFGKTGGRQFPGKSCLRTGSFAAPRTLDFFTGAGFGALRQICKKRVSSDSPVEGDGFELSVPRVMGGDSGRRVPAAIAVFELASTADVIPSRQRFVSSHSGAFGSKLGSH